MMKTMTYQEMVDHVFKRHARIRNLDIRLEELRWVDRQIAVLCNFLPHPFDFPNEIEPALSDRIKRLEQELRRLVIAVGDDDAK